VRQLWHWLLLTPIAYLLLARLGVRLGWIDADPAAPHPWDNPWGRWGVGIATAVIVGGLLWVRRLRRVTVRMPADDPGAALRRWVWDFYLTAAFCDTLALLGFIFFAVSGREWALLAWGAAFYLGDLLVYPRPSELEGLGEAPRDR
jgi:hypothetical protein